MTEGTEVTEMSAAEAEATLVALGDAWQKVRPVYGFPNEDYYWEASPTLEYDIRSTLEDGLYNCVLFRLPEDGINNVEKEYHYARLSLADAKAACERHFATGQWT